MYHPPHVSVITGNILVMLIRFSRYHFLLASNSTFMTDSMYLGTIQVCRNLNEHYYYLITLITNHIRDLANRRELFSIPVVEYASFSHQARTLKII